MVWLSQHHPHERDHVERVCDRCDAVIVPEHPGVRLSVTWPACDGSRNAYRVDLCALCRVQFEAWMLPPPPLERCA